MYDPIINLSLITIFSPLIGAIIAGVFGFKISNKVAHSVTIAGIFISTIASANIAWHFLIQGHSLVNVNLYTWLSVGTLHFNVGLWVDSLTAIMLIVVTSISLLVHIYSIGYMHDDPGYKRFFAYMSMFTFAMLVLVFAPNGLQLFFGWEGVGVVSYLLISFWYTKPSATAGGFKAFLVNRVGDLGFLLGLAVCFGLFSSLDYASWFANVENIIKLTYDVPLFGQVPVIDVMCLLLFVGAMGKSAQVPLHVWLPESMEGPTPISALIHAATMVTAGVYMVCRLSPIFEFSPVALNFILIIGSTGALFLGLLGLVQNDIKRVVAYSTLSQLGYMIAATGASAYSASIFHLVTHAFFKALLFLGAGSVIVAVHHEQDMTKMGGLKKYLPITFFTFLIGGISLTAIPPFSGFFSKDSIIAAVNLSNLPGSSYASVCLTLGAFVTALYTFRSIFMTFYGRKKYKGECKESPMSICLPLIILAVPSIFLGLFFIKYIFATTTQSAMSLASTYKTTLVLNHLQHESQSIISMVIASLTHLPFIMSILGILTSWVCYVKRPEIPALIVRKTSFLHKILLNKYGFDDFNEIVFVKKLMNLSQLLSSKVDNLIIDNKLVHGVANFVLNIGSSLRIVQTGYLYHYTAAIGFGILLFLIVSVF